MPSIKGENTKQNIEVKVKELNMSDRMEFNDYINGRAKMLFSDYVHLIKLATDFTDIQLNEFTDIEISQIADLCYSVINKKKLPK